VSALRSPQAVLEQETLTVKIVPSGINCCCMILIAVPLLLPYALVRAGIEKLRRSRA